MSSFTKLEDPSLEYKKYTFTSGAVYEGTFKGTKRHGQGHWQHPQGEIYEGEYKDNKQHGYGIYLFTSGKRYLGQWENNEMNGKGIYYFAPGDVTYYAGNYKNDKKCGSGYYLYENGVMTVQRWDNGVMITESDATPRDRLLCAIYISDLTNIIKKVAPKQVPGFPADHHKHSNHKNHNFDNNNKITEKIKTFKFPSGATYTGEYYKTKKWGKGHWTHPEGDEYIGEFEDNKHNGWGIYIIGNSKKKYIGQWLDGKMHGFGAYFFTEDEKEFFIGNYKNDKKCGSGLYHFAESGNNKIQVWEDGQLVKEKDAEGGSDYQYFSALRLLFDVIKEVAVGYTPVLDVDRLRAN